jgi:hypothetical protein
MNRENYVFDSNEQCAERNRLAALQEIHDPTTKRLLTLLELGSGKHAPRLVRAKDQLLVTWLIWWHRTVE